MTSEHNTSDESDSPELEFTLTRYQAKSLIKHLRNRTSHLSDEGNTNVIADDLENQVPDRTTGAALSPDDDEEIQLSLTAYQIGWMQETLVTGKHDRDVDKDDPGHKLNIRERVARQTDMPSRHWDDIVYEAARDLEVYVTQELAERLGFDDPYAQVDEFDVVDSNVGMIQADVVERHGTREIDGIDTAQWKFVGTGNPEKDAPAY